MSVTQRLVFDVTDSDSILSSSNVGSWTRAGTDGALIDSKAIGGTEWLQVAAALYAGTTALTQTGGALNVSIASGSLAVDLNGVYDVGTNPTPDNVGIIAHTRPSGSDDTTQTLRLTGGAAVGGPLTGDDMSALDVLSVIYGYNQDTGGLVRIGSNADNGGDRLWTSLNGKYDAQNTKPSTTGMLLRDRGASPDETTQEQPITGADNTADALVAADIHSMDTAAFGYVFNGTTWDRLRGTSGAVNVSDGGGSLTVDAVNLDIRDLVFATDKVDVSGSSVSITGTTTVSDAALANTAISNAAVSIGTTAASAYASILSNRKYAFLYNNGNHAVYLGTTGVTTANGFPAFPGMGYEFRAGAAIDIKAISTNAAQDVRVLQLS